MTDPSQVADLSRPADPFSQFDRWFAAAQATEPSYPDACALATVELVDGQPRPAVRIVLLKGVTDGTFHLYTNYSSAKGLQLDATGYAALDFYWKSQQRQVRVSGPVRHQEAALSDAYFATRPRESQLSAWASLQSQPLDSRATFEERLAEMDARYPGAVPRPPHWGGYDLLAERIEFWEERIGRQHHRLLFEKAADGWRSQLLYP